MYDGIGAARFAKEAKHHFHRAQHFCIGVRNDAALLVVAITNRERETQLAFFRFVELTALEARVQENAPSGFWRILTASANVFGRSVPFANISSKPGR